MKSSEYGLVEIVDQIAFRPLYEIALYEIGATAPQYSDASRVLDLRRYDFDPFFMGKFDELFESLLGILQKIVIELYELNREVFEHALCFSSKGNSGQQG